MTTTPIRAVEAAKLLGISPKSLRLLVKRKKIASIRYGDEGYHYFDPDEIERFKTGCTTPTNAPKKPLVRRRLGPDSIPRDEWGDG